MLFSSFFSRAGPVLGTAAPRMSVLKISVPSGGFSRVFPFFAFLPLSRLLPLVQALKILTFSLISFSVGSRYPGVLMSTLQRHRDLVPRLFLSPL